MGFNVKTTKATFLLTMPNFVLKALREKAKKRKVSITFLILEAVCDTILTDSDDLRINMFKTLYKGGLK